MPWEAIGKFAILLLALLVVQGVLAIVELYWPSVYRWLTMILVTGGLALWLFSEEPRS